MKRNGCQKSLQESFKLAGHALSNILSPARNSSPISSPKPKKSLFFLANGKITAQDIQIDVQNVILLCAMNIQFYIVSIVNNIN